MADGNGVTNGKGPWWSTLIQTVGPTAAIAIFLVYVLAAQVQPALSDIKGFMAQHVTQMQVMSEQLAKEDDVQQKQWESMQRITTQEHTDREKALAVDEQTCINSAKSPYQTQQCISARNLGEGMVDVPP